MDPLSTPAGVPRTVPARRHWAAAFRPALRPGRPGPVPSGTRLALVRDSVAHPVRLHLAVLAGYLVAGIAFSWPRVTYLTGHQLPASRDAGSYVWGFAWIARQLGHLSNPWFTHAIVAPAGVPLGFHALIPLEGLLMAPVTMVFGPSASYNVLSAIMPGLLSYAMYRVGRLWLPDQLGAIAAGAFFGLSSMLVWRSWYHLNLAAGVLFIPLALEAAVRLRRRPGWRRAVVLGVVMAGALLTDQEMDVLVIIVVVAALAPWLLLSRTRADLLGRAWPAALATAVFAVVASPQIIAMAEQTGTGGALPPASALAVDYANSGVPFPDMFALSPRVYQFGLHWLTYLTYHGGFSDGIADFGLAVSALAVLGLVVSWHRPNARLLGLLWLGCTVLILGATLRIGDSTFVPAAETWHGAQLSMIMPFTWFTRVPGLQGFREACGSACSAWFLPRCSPGVVCGGCTTTGRASSSPP